MARKAGRGGLAVGAAKVFFLVVGFGQQLFLARILGPVGYGALSRVLAIANIANNVVVAGGIQGASREIAQASEVQRSAVQRRVLVLHACLAPPLALLFFFVGPFIAERTGGAHVVLHLRVLSVVVLAYSVYAALVGVMNGREMFGRQAAVDALYATLRTVGLIAGGALLVTQGYRMGALGSVLGFALAALLIVPVAVRLIGIGEPGPGGPTTVKYLSFLGPLVVAQLLLNGLMQADITLLGRFAADAAGASGLTGDEASAAADRVVAVYRSCQLFSFLPYQLLFAITFILFPMLAKAHADGDAPATRLYVQNGARLAFLLGGAIVAVTSGLPSGVLHLAFEPEIADHGAAALRTLALGQGAFALFGVATTVLNSTGHERATVLLNAGALALVFSLAVLLLPGVPLALLPQRMALVMAIALAAALAFGGAWVYRTTGALLPVLSGLRIAAALAVAATLGAFLPVGGKVLTLACAGIVVLVYAVVLLATREVGRDDLALVSRVIRRGKAAT